VDGLLLTRRERLRGFGERTGLIVGPSLVLAFIELVSGLWAVALLVTAIAGLTALALGSTLRTRRSAAIFGLLLACGILLFLLATGWFISHPIQRGD
jgi:apolipoprotein N-acyltransferase